MAFSLPDFLHARLVDSGLADIGQDLQTGMKTSVMPEQLRQEAKSRELANELASINLPFQKNKLEQEQTARDLANALAGVQLPYAGGQASADLDSTLLKNKLDQQKIDYPGLSSSDPTAQLLEIIRMQSDRGAQGAPSGFPAPPNSNQANIFSQQALAQPDIAPGIQAATSEPSEQVGEYDPYKAIIDHITSSYPAGPYRDVAIANIKKNKADLQRKEQIVKNTPWDNMTPEAKKETEAFARAMGIMAFDLGKAASEGKSLYDLAYDKGYSKDDVDKLTPLFMTSIQNISELQKRNANVAAANILHKFITKGIGPNVRTIMGYSPNNIKNQITGQNKEEQANYLAALALTTDQAGLQLQMSGGPVTGAIADEYVKKTLGDAKVNQFLVSQDVYNLAQDKIHDLINRMNNAYGHQMMSRPVTPPSIEATPYIGKDENGRDVLLTEEEAAQERGLQ